MHKTMHRWGKTDCTPGRWPPRDLLLGRDVPPCPQRPGVVPTRYAAPIVDLHKVHSPYYCWF